MYSETVVSQVRLLTLNNPPVNALTTPMLEGIQAAIEGAQAEGLKGTVVAGTAGAFCAGLDVKILASAEKSELLDLFTALSSTLRCIAISPLPTVCAITGHCLGAGAALAALCDHRIMTTGAYKIGFPEARLGIPLSSTLTAAVARIVGPANAAVLCNDGLLPTATQAQNMGLVEQASNSEEAVAASLHWIEQYDVCRPASSHSAALRRPWAEAYNKTRDEGIKPTVEQILKSRRDGLIQDR